MSFGPIEITWQGVFTFFIGTIAAAGTWGGLYQRLKLKQEELARQVEQVKRAAAERDTRNDGVHREIFGKLDTCGLQLNQMNAQHAEMATTARHTQKRLDEFISRYEARCDASDALTREHIAELKRFNDKVERQAGAGK